MKIAFKMKLKPGFKEEYRKRHSNIPPELRELLVREGISDYTIFLDEETHILFAVQQQAGHSSQELGGNEAVRQWWDYMSDIMEVNPDNSPVSVPLEQLFHLS